MCYGAGSGMGGCVFFFFKQKTAYEIMPSLVGSEMCIRDRSKPLANKVLGEDYEVLEEMKGKDLEGLEYEQLMPFVEAVSYTHLTLPTTPYV
ncbi:hypothetical protein CDFC105_43920 [Clostridioides difficile]|nr:hypothetical protein CDFC105_43920 [Clostridioides difficile]